MRKSPIVRSEKGANAVLIRFFGEVFLQEKLWRYGYRAKHMSHNSKYDLLVADKGKKWGQRTFSLAIAGAFSGRLCVSPD